MPPHQRWIVMFSSAVETFQKQAAQDTSVPDAAAKAAAFAARYCQILADLLADPWRNIPGYGVAELDCIRLCKIREDCLRAVGFVDIFADVKRREDENALQLLQPVLRDLDTETSTRARIQKALRGVFAGNVFDLGAAASAKLFEEGGASFVRTRESLVGRPWAVDDFDEVVSRLCTGRYRKAMMFVDNAGSDVVLGAVTGVQRACYQVLRAAELATVVGAAARLDSIIDRGVTEGALAVVATGNDLPVIDLSQVSAELAAACEGVDLVVLEGMGRAIETNLHAQLTCDKINLGMIKHPEVAAMFNGRLYDCVCRFMPGRAS